MKITNKLKKIGKGLLTMTTAFAALVAFSACGQKNVVETNKSDVQSEKVEISSSVQGSTIDSTVESQQPQQPTKVAASEVIESVIGQKDFENVFNNALVSIVEKEYPGYNVADVSVDSVKIQKNGKFVLNATLENNGVVSSTQVTYEGDTTAYKTFFAYGMDKEKAMKETMRILTLSSIEQLTVGSTREQQVRETFEEDITDFDTQTQLFKAITAEELTSKALETKPNEDEYVSVESIVNEAFAGIDFNADLMETVEKIFATRAPTNKLNKVYAVDFEIAQDGHFTFYVEMGRTTSDSIYIAQYTINDVSQFSNYLNLISNNREEFINTILSENSLNINSQIVKGSDAEKTLKNALDTVIAEYNNEKTGLGNVEKTNIKADTIFSPKQFTEQEMQELGIDNMNAFAEALFNNTRGDGFDQVQGVTMDDVVATYVSEFSVQNIYGESVFDILIMTNEGLESHRIRTIRASNDSQNRYAMFLNDNPNKVYVGIEDRISYSENVILYSNNEDLLLLSQKDSALLDNGYTYVETTGSEDKPAIQFLTK